MRYSKLFLIMTLAFATTESSAHTAQIILDQQVQTAFQDFFNLNKNKEYFSGATLSYRIPGHPIANLYLGQESHDSNSKKISSNTLFQIGSLTKSFAAVVILQLEKEGKLSINDTMNTWLPEYKKWSGISIRKLLNMTSGVPNYTDSPMWYAEEVKDPGKEWNNEELISLAYPPGNFAPPIRRDYNYTNTSYILLDLISAKAGNDSFSDQVQNRILKPQNLRNTFYPVPSLTSDVQARIAHGYFYNQYDNPSLVGRDMVDNNLSWGGAAGSMVSTSEDIVKWVTALFTDNSLLPPAKRAEMEQLVSLDSGAALTKLSDDEPKGFGLGVIESYDASMPANYYWSYEGETLGFRAHYVYTPCNGVVVSAVFNSATNSENDHAGELVRQIYNLIIQNYPNLDCKGTQ